MKTSAEKARQVEAIVSNALTQLAEIDIDMDTLVELNVSELSLAESAGKIFKSHMTLEHTETLSNMLVELDTGFGVRPTRRFALEVIKTYIKRCYQLIADIKLSEIKLMDALDLLRKNK